MDKGKILRLVLIPIVAGLIVTLLAQRLMSQSEQASGPAVEMVPAVVVATSDPIPPRIRLTASQFAVKEIPKALATGNELTDLKEVDGQIATVALQPGEVVLKQRIVAEGQGSLPYRIPEGKRAVAIRLDELNGVAGYPEEGDLVDLILFLPEKKVEEPVKFTYPAQSRILYEGILVLAKGLAEGVAPEADARGVQELPGEPKLSSITLALTPEQATEVALAEQVGYIKLMLRPALKQPDAGSYQTDEAKYRNNPWVLGR